MAALLIAGVIDLPLGVECFHPPLGGAFSFTYIFAQADTRHDAGVPSIPDLYAASARPYSAAFDFYRMF